MNVGVTRRPPNTHRMFASASVQTAAPCRPASSACCADALVCNGDRLACTTPDPSNRVARASIIIIVIILIYIIPTAVPSWRSDASQGPGWLTTIIMPSLSAMHSVSDVSMVTRAGFDPGRRRSKASSRARDGPATASDTGRPRTPSPRTAMPLSSISRHPSAPCSNTLSNTSSCPARSACCCASCPISIAASAISAVCRPSIRRLASQSGADPQAAGPPRASGSDANLQAAGPPCRGERRKPASCRPPVCIGERRKPASCRRSVRVGASRRPASCRPSVSGSGCGDKCGRGEPGP